MAYKEESQSAVRVWLRELSYQNKKNLTGSVSAISVLISQSKVGFVKPLYTELFVGNTCANIILRVEIHDILKSINFYCLNIQTFWTPP